jgi:hypothetical protein
VGGVPAKIEILFTHPLLNGLFAIIFLIVAFSGIYLVTNFSFLDKNLVYILFFGSAGVLQTYAIFGAIKNAKLRRTERSSNAQLT